MSKIKKETKAVDTSTEEKIKNAARIVFQKKGFAATRTRDIAEEASINLALLNYYFRSKEKLFEIVMFETLSGFVQGMVTVFNDEKSSFEKKIELLATTYINVGIEFPDVPMFILSEIRSRPGELFDKFPAKQMVDNSVFVRQFKEKVKAGEINEPNLLQFLMNLLGLIIFPIVGRPFVSAIGGLNDTQYIKLMQERKKLIPVWVKAMFFNK
jgi:AcrR family transcriptional regulator